MSDLARKILGNTAAQIIGKLVMALLSIVTLKILTNYLSMTRYGEYTYIYDFLALFGILADLGLYTISVREMSKDETQIPKILGNVLSIRTIVGFLGMGVAVIASFYANNFVPRGTGPDALSEGALIIAVALGAFTVFLALINGTLTTILQKYLKMHEASYAMILGRIVAVAYMAYVALIAYTQDPHTGFFHLIFAGVLGNIAMIGLTFYYTRKLTTIRYQLDWDFCKKILAKSIPFGIALILSTIYFRTNTILLRFWIGPEEVGIYAVAGRAMTEAITIALYFMNSVLPVLTESISKKDGRHQRIIQYAFDFLALAILPAVAGGVVVAYPVIKIISEPKYLSRLAENFYGSDIIFQILLFAMFFAFLTTLFSFLLVALNEQKKLLYLNLGGIFINLGLNSFMIPLYASRGAAITSIFAEIFLAIACYLVAKKYLNFSISLKNVSKAIVAAGIMGVIIYFLRDPTFALMQNKNLFLLIPLGAGIYTGLLLLFRAVPSEVMAMIFKKAVPEEING